MNRISAIIASFCLVALASCGPRKGNGNGEPAVRRAFQRVDVPAVITDSDERLAWGTAHFWDNYLNPATAVNDTLNGVTLDELEQEVGTFTGLLNLIPAKDAFAAVERFWGQLEAFQKAQEKSLVFKHLYELVERYLYDPNSPLRNEDLCVPLFKGRLGSPLTPDSMREYYSWQVKMCSMNSVGTKAADFTFIDTAGKKRSLYGIRADYLVLIFGNPDCAACRELMDAMSFVPEIVNLSISGRLKIADIYIDEDVAAWKAGAAGYPPTWINGYDPSGAIRGDLLYHVRAIPSIYLLDASKTVLLKDATQERLLAYLQEL